MFAHKLLQSRQDELSMFTLYNASRRDSAWHHVLVRPAATWPQLRTTPLLAVPANFLFERDLGAATLSARCSSKKVKYNDQGLLSDWTSAIPKTARSKFLLSDDAKPTSGPDGSYNEQPQAATSYGGYVDSDEDQTEERRQLTAQRPQRAQTSLVKIKPSASSPGGKVSDDSNHKGMKTADAIKELGNEPGDLAVWTGKVIPTYELYIACRENPFAPGVTQAERQLDSIIALVFPDRLGTIPLAIKNPRCVIFRVANQRKQEAFNAMGKLALKLVEDHFEQNSDDFILPKQRMTYALNMLLPDSTEDLPFVWRDFDRDGKKAGLFMHPFILTVMAEYMRRTDGAVKEYGQPRGALLLAVLAVERAFSLYIRGGGKLGPEKPAFSEQECQWSTDSFRSAISNITTHRWQKITSAVDAIIAGRKDGAAPNTLVANPAIHRKRAYLTCPDSP
ncbi:hypothetical protein K474DRAFT_1671957 [Panus rudis PR-1116 ss-1]|nr:hypothetical protein K474DRAFT_1671957 [Panus rudis PR-1116 ss-1]